MRGTAAHPFSFVLAACCSDVRPGGGGLAGLISDSLWLAVVVGMAVALTWAVARAAAADPARLR